MATHDADGLRLPVVVLNGALVFEHEGVHPGADLPRRERHVAGDAVVEGNLAARRHILFLLLGILPEEERVV